MTPSSPSLSPATWGVGGEQIPANQLSTFAQAEALLAALNAIPAFAALNCAIQPQGTENTSPGSPAFQANGVVAGTLVWNFVTPGGITWNVGELLASVTAEGSWQYSNETGPYWQAVTPPPPVVVPPVIPPGPNLPAGAAGIPGAPVAAVTLETISAKLDLILSKL